MNLKLIFGMMLTGLVFLFVAQNATVVEIRFMFWQVTMSRSLLVLLLLAIGIMAGWLLHSLSRHRVKKATGEDSHNGLDEERAE